MTESILSASTSPTSPTSLSPSPSSPTDSFPVVAESTVAQVEPEKDKLEQLKRDVYGETYRAAEEEYEVLLQDLVQRVGIGFTDAKECTIWAHEHILDKLLYSPMSHRFFNVSHKGEIIADNVFQQYYGNILFYRVVSSQGVERRVPWTPNSFAYYDRACIPAEQSDGTHAPLYHRSYVTPSGFFNRAKGTFNVAKPFPVFAKETGRDTSHIYIYIQHIAGECAMWLLAWLRAKMLYPNVKTQVVPIIVSRAQGSGKTTFAEVICKGLFGKENVIVSDQYDATARFNADYADALIVCQEEKELEDKRNPAGALKSRATATTIRKEQKGVDPIYQESYTDFIMTTNKDVPVKFDGREDQRRFMIMEADENFTRRTSSLADEVFTKLYGYDANYHKRGIPFTEDKDLIAQFKHELFTRADIAAVELRKFPKTAAYKRCFTLPRTSEATEIESILRALAPFLRASLDQGVLVTELGEEKLEEIVKVPVAVRYIPAFSDTPAHIALCRPLVFYDADSYKPFQHSVVERSLYDCAPWLREEYQLGLIPDMEPLMGGFPGVPGRYRMAPTARICLASELHKTSSSSTLSTLISTSSTKKERKKEERVGKILRVNSRFRADEEGCFETVNEMKEGVVDLVDKTHNVQYMDTFLLESDDMGGIYEKLEQKRADEWTAQWGRVKPIEAEKLYSERLKLQKNEALKLLNDGVARRVVYSGAKSVHILVRIQDAPDTLEQYHWLHSYLCSTVSDKLYFDMSTSDPARLTRSPITLRRASIAYGCNVIGTQCLVAEMDNVWDLKWRKLWQQWVDRPMSVDENKLGRKFLPAKPIYYSALLAIRDGTFWSDSKWNGQRQELFFPVYRLFRSMGYSHEQLWTDTEGGVLFGIEDYGKREEIGYWRSRENSTLIQTIDESIEENKEDD